MKKKKKRVLDSSARTRLTLREIHRAAMRTSPPEKYPSLILQEIHFRAANIWQTENGGISF